MKEKIYTIPINEAFEQNSECPFCYIEKKLEKDAVEYALGAAMMEPDYRIVSNEKGYCNKHFSMLLAQPNKLSLSLVVQTHLDEIIKNLKSHTKDIENIGKKSLFKKNVSPAKAMAEEINKIQEKCVICEETEKNLARYTDTFFYMWEKDNELRKKVEGSKGFCLKHFSKLCVLSYSKLKKPDEFVKTAYNLELENLERLKDEIHKFTLKFDYRNKDMDLGEAVDSPVRTIEKLRGYTIGIKEENS